MTTRCTTVTGRACRNRLTGHAGQSQSCTFHYHRAHGMHGLPPGFARPCCPSGLLRLTKSDVTVPQPNRNLHSIAIASQGATLESDKRTTSKGA
jgi:hypothetical protein